MPMAHKMGNSEKRQMRTGATYLVPGNPGKRMVDANRAERLRRARLAAGYIRAADAVRAFGWNRSTYYGHENARRGISRDKIMVYAEAFHVERDWLASGRGMMRGRGPQMIRIEGLVLGNLTVEYREGLGEIELPAGISPEEFRAFRVQGDIYPIWLDSEVILVRRDHGPPEEYLGKRCVVRLRDTGEWLVRILQPGSRHGLFLLQSHALPPIVDAKISEAAPIAVTLHS
jgi:hypothetical protein